MAGTPRSIFARIAAGEIPCQKVFENEHVLAFLDINPIADGHTLVIPKTPVAHLDELPPELAAELGRVLAVVARRVLQATGAAGYNVLLNNGRVAGQEVEHVHFHVVPRRADDGLGYRWRPQKRTPAELDALAAKIRAVP